MKTVMAGEFHSDDRVDRKWCSDGIAILYFCPCTTDERDTHDPDASLDKHSLVRCVKIGRSALVPIHLRIESNERLSTLHVALSKQLSDINVQG